MQENDYANQLGDQLEIILDHGTDELDDIVSRLNESGVRPPSGQEWSADIFVAELRRLGA